MSEERYECPHCGCQDCIGYIEDVDTQGIQYRKIDGKWKQVTETVGRLSEFYYCPACEKQLPNDAVLKWLKEPRED